MAQHAEEVLGEAVAERFGESFPIRFDYLDTLGGGDLSIQCHPSEAYMRETFGLPYTQHETYYVTVTTPGARIFLGLREDADLEAFREEAAQAEDPGRPFAPERYLETHPAVQHRLYLIPAGTPHAERAGNVVLEISATPYLYTLRFYDWLRRDLDGELRPVRTSSMRSRTSIRAGEGKAVRRELIPEPVIVREGPGWAELALSTLPELFFAVHRLDFMTTSRTTRSAAFMRSTSSPASWSTSLRPPATCIRSPTPRRSSSRRGRRVPHPPPKRKSCKVVKAFVR